MPEEVAKEFARRVASLGVTVLHHGHDVVIPGEVRYIPDELSIRGLAHMLAQKAGVEVVKTVMKDEPGLLFKFLKKVK